MSVPCNREKSSWSWRRLSTVYTPLGASLRKPSGSRGWGCAPRHSLSLTFVKFLMPGTQSSQGCAQARRLVEVGRVAQPSLESATTQTAQSTANLALAPQELDIGNPVALPAREARVRAFAV